MSIIACLKIDKGVHVKVFGDKEVKDLLYFLKKTKSNFQYLIEDITIPTDVSTGEHLLDFVESISMKDKRITLARDMAGLLSS